MESGDAPSTPISTLLKPSEERGALEGQDGAKEQGSERISHPSGKSYQQATESKLLDCSLNASNSLNNTPLTYTEAPTLSLSQTKLLGESNGVDRDALLSESSENSESSVKLSFSE